MTTDTQRAAFEALLTDFYHACTSTWPFDGVLSYKDARAAVLAAFEAASATAEQVRRDFPNLNDAARAVLRNENCVYDSEDDLYAALCAALAASPAPQNSKETQ